MRIEASYLGIRSTWADGKKQRVDQCLNAFMVGLVVAAQTLKSNRLEREARERAWQAAEEHRKQEARRREEEAARVRALQQALTRWRDARDIRDYVAEIRQAAGLRMKVLLTRRSFNGSAGSSNMPRGLTQRATQRASPGTQGRPDQASRGNRPASTRRLPQVSGQCPVTTPLDKPLVRELLRGDQAYKVSVSPSGIRITPKRGRKGLDISWEVVFALTQAGDTVSPPQAVQPSEVPRPIAADLAKELAAARAALSRAVAELSRVGSLPPALLMETDPDPVYSQREERTDWYVEPMLTPHEVASILRVSRSAVRRLGIPWVDIGGEQRYRQSEVRRYLVAHEARY